MSPSVVVTGMGVWTGLGKTTEDNWHRLTKVPDTKEHYVAPLCQAPNMESGFERAQVLSLAVCEDALKKANLWRGNQLGDVDPARVGCLFSASKPLFFRSVPDTTDHHVAPLCQAPEVINQVVAQTFGIQGESRNVIAACATGAYAIALGASWIEQGLCDVVLAGSVEPYPHPLIAAGFEQMGVRSAEPIMRPFDRKRSGFVFGEGAGAVVLESAGHARRRNATPLARISGWGLGTDTHSAFAFNSNGQMIAQVIGRALTRAGVSPQAVSHVNAHGTATRLNDWIESQALRHAFGSHAPALHISATKSATGHLLGAAGSVELVFTVLALQHQFIPPTRHLEEIDPQCGLDYTPQQGKKVSFDHALSLSFGFGGPIGALVVGRP